MHCAALLGAHRPAPDPLAEIGSLASRLARVLAPDLASLCGGKPPHVRALPAEVLADRDLGERIGPLAGNFALRAAGVPLLVSIEALAIFAQLERSLGGPAEAPAELPDAFPTSAKLLLDRLVARVVRCLGNELGKEVTCERGDPDYAALAAFTPGTQMAVAVLEIAPADARPWEITLALPLDRVAALPGGPAQAAGRKTRRAPTDAPFADLPLPLEARLVDMSIRLSQLAGLAPGTVLPVAVARQVPLCAGRRRIAEGTLGEMDDRIALRITHSFVGKDLP